MHPWDRWVPTAELQISAEYKSRDGKIKSSKEDRVREMSSLRDTGSCTPCAPDTQVQPTKQKHERYKDTAVLKIQKTFPPDQKQNTGRAS